MTSPSIVVDGFGQTIEVWPSEDANTVHYSMTGPQGGFKANGWLTIDDATTLAAAFLSSVVVAARRS
jgi:hypothetical protein